MSEVPRKILLIHHGGGIGGAPVSMLQMAAALDRTRFEPLAVFTESGPILDFAEELGVPARVVPMRSAFFYGAQVPVHPRMLLRFLAGYAATVRAARRLVPQPWQNFCPGSASWPHSGHSTTRGSVVPHSPQNAASSGFGCRQPGQSTSEILTPAREADALARHAARRRAPSIAVVSCSTGYSRWLILGRYLSAARRSLLRFCSMPLDLSDDIAHHRRRSVSGPIRREPAGVTLTGAVRNLLPP